MAFHSQPLKDLTAPLVKVKSVCYDWWISTILFYLFNSFCYCRSDDWVLNFRIELNSLFSIRKAYILYFRNNIIKLQQCNEKNYIKSANLRGETLNYRSGAVAKELLKTVF